MLKTIKRNATHFIVSNQTAIDVDVYSIIAVFSFVFCLGAKKRKEHRNNIDFELKVFRTKIDDTRYKFIFSFYCRFKLNEQSFKKIALLFVGLVNL